MSEKAGSEKLQKVLARAGVGSRREMEEWISSGRVTVDGKPATLGDRISPNQQVRVDGHPVQIASEAEQICRVLAYHKPEGEICSRTDPEGRPTVFSRLPNIKGARWIAIGRLDINTSGLLLFTTDGELANRLMHPKFEVEREYAVRVFGDVNDAMIQRLRIGVELEDGKANFKKIKALPGEGINRWFHVVLTEGRNREVRRMWESQGAVVSRLIRVRYGDLLLPKHLPAGGYAEYPLDDVNYLRKLVSLAPEVATLVKPEDRDERRRRMASMKRAVRKHDIAAKTPERTPKERKPTEARTKPDGAKPAGRRGPAAPKGKAPKRQPTGKKPSREGRN
ncbi:23S rRNA pseudouridine(2605) synthase RluB [Rheinheimera baltica]|uniref:23S rRNA pseudouridine(2605) synthase RluB n=1 Tax=Rheinheimera baltica TaxID=67576 RepID=UPI00273EA7A7|nr:23S rRNA pseudouridine(2605) synthase RluB [Rheinheimera baltica]MDP5141230.1 23S rRNA pseudouridine(2605) synthase RluB [Rheinheimera baltica]MDP5148459.1 23S rRNA pseudouridine(2605) synthase RluB [Rheinheimera baltica]MDP5188892.1 23S rRNA pseudouridine(2605) synthase RluB [Rheinheimera baltica]